MKLTFFGTRGSTPVSGQAYARWGGNTTCMALEADGQLFVIDCGTGLQTLQSAFFDSGRYTEATIFLSHLHWDHIQGVPFFGPLFHPACRFAIYAERRYGVSFQTYLEEMMRSPMFPIKPSSFNADITYRDFSCGSSIQLGAVRVDTARLNHPNICTGYRFTCEGRSVCIAADYEHGGEPPDALAAGADVLVYDGQYTDAEYPAKKDWGHSTWREGCDLAARCGAKRLIITHHDPSHTDNLLDEMEREARRADPGIVFARDGMTLDI